MLQQRAISSIFIVILTLGAAFFGRLLFTAVIAAILALALREAYRMFEHAGHRPLVPLGYGALGLFMGAVLVRRWEEWGAGLVTIAVLLPLVAILFRRSHDGALVNWTVTVAGALYIGLTGIHFILLRDLTGTLPSFLAEIDQFGRLPAVEYYGDTTLGLGWFLLAQIVAWLTDVGAYLVGSRWGRHRLAPKVSPGKSVEGAVGGLVAAALAALACDYAFSLPLSPPVAFAVGGLLSAIGQVGDLAESLLKRQTGVKDSGALIPGHGGILDRIDSLLFIVVATYYIARLAG